MKDIQKSARASRTVTADTKIRTSKESVIAQRIRNASEHIMKKNDQIYKDLADR